MSDFTTFGRCELFAPKKMSRVRRCLEAIIPALRRRRERREAERNLSLGSIFGTSEEISNSIAGYGVTQGGWELDEIEFVQGGIRPFRGKSHYVSGAEFLRSFKGR